MEIARRRPFGANPSVGERGTETQNKILAAGLEVFAEVGFDAARVELITEHLAKTLHLLALCRLPLLLCDRLAGDLGYDVAGVTKPCIALKTKEYEGRGDYQQQ